MKHEVRMSQATAELTIIHWMLQCSALFAQLHLCCIYSWVTLPSDVEYLTHLNIHDVEYEH